MQITIKYFGQLTEITHIEEETLEISGTYIFELLETLYRKYNTLKTKDFQVAQNQELVSKETELTGAEIALLPPFAGG
ncbi:MoaD/ThiS family protein [Algibacter amylolyticus]|uniref:Molybdopterin synthase sulfur carrier subunit n=1 Tax=Algibacter amylolyticus TaxID=1608400 RepID=A0A5M7B270_9FLAO|nr:MoaD/ThiS family protein [Algibacter amylolyticus]KAA5822317.1 MoaD/ThiS family protein [Algibacter amylolyticus]MBB5269031.1 molybdopterin synthase sulfur carrier subunit [Algibacter amylolyticus]TSJ73467.1 MoaD/ThiS family protein [Algibacter amylolyticus]